MVTGNTKVKIGVLVPNFPHIIQPYILNQIVYLSKKGLPVTVVAYERGEAGQQQDVIHQYRLLDNTIYINPDGTRGFLTELVNALRMNIVHPTTFWQRLRKIGATLKVLDYGWKYFAKSILRILASNLENVDIVHSHSLFMTYDYLYLKRIFGKPLITTFHGLVPENAGWIQEDKLAQVLKTGDLFLANTGFAKSQLQSLGCRNEKIVLVPQGIDLNTFRFQARKLSSQSTVTLLSVARLSPEKGLDYAVRAVCELTPSLNLQYRIVGAGPQRSDLIALSKKLKINERIRLLGTMDHSRLLLEYFKADILLVPSVKGRTGCQETQGVVIQEAQATGLPVIATRTGGIPECVIDGNTGLLVEERNPKEIADAIQFLIKHPDKYRELSYAGRRYVEQHFDINKICETLFGIYQEMAGKPKRISKPCELK